MRVWTELMWLSIVFSGASNEPGKETLRKVKGREFIEYPRDDHMLHI
jgi:hypothetical protein